MRRIALVLLLLMATAAWARIGGGDSYSGDSSSSSDSSSSYSSDSSDSGSSSSSSGGSSTSGGNTMFSLAIWLVIMLFGGVANATKSKNAAVFSAAVRQAPPPPADLGALREHDPNFSEVVFTDFCYSLFARVHEARGRGRLGDFAPYLAADVRAQLAAQNPLGLTSVDAIVIGSFNIGAFRGVETPKVEIEVEFEANYSETAANGTHRWYVRDAWVLTRARDLLSPRPEQARAEHCPKCGAALETRTDGACLHCGTIVTDGSFNWFVTAIRPIKKDERPPELGGPAGPEPGLDRPTVMQPWIGRTMKSFTERHPGFTWPAFEERVRVVATELQNAWSARDWRRARPFETDALFQTHRYWIDEYERQDLRNLVDDYAIGKVDVVKVRTDAFYDAITVRLFASGFDYTVDARGSIVGGAKTTRKHWSEYWTLIRGRGGAPAGARVCPNCGGALADGETAVCEYCGGKIATGDFPWVLSRIEQDEAYRG